MKLLTNFFSSAATKRPVTTILVIVAITGFFGFMTTQAEELDTGFGGEIDTPEIEAQGKLSDYFGGSGTQSVMQLVFEGEDVLTVSKLFIFALMPVTRDKIAALIQIL